MAFRFKATAYQAPLSPGVYPATLEAIEEREGQRKGFLIWRFAVEVDGRQVSVSTTTSQYCGPKAKARHFAEVLLGRPLVPDEEFDPPTLFGRPCRVVVIVVELDDHSTVNRVETVLPPAQEADIPF
jgi:hypothetical protein